MIFAEKFYQFLVENLMLLAEKCDDFCKKMLTIFLWKVDNFCGKILRFLEENLMPFARKHGDFCRKIWQRYVHTYMVEGIFLTFIKKKKKKERKKISLPIDKEYYRFLPSLVHSVQWHTNDVTFWGLHRKWANLTLFNNLGLPIVHTKIFSKYQKLSI